MSWTARLRRFWLVWQSIIFIGGLAPAPLAVTGTIIWLRRRARRRALKGKAEPATLAAPE